MTEKEPVAHTAMTGLPQPSIAEPALEASQERAPTHFWWNPPVPTRVVWAVLGAFGTVVYVSLSESHWLGALAEIATFAIIARAVWTKVLPRLWELLLQVIRELLPLFVPLLAALLAVATISAVVWLAFAKPLTAIALALLAITALLYIMIKSQHTRLGR